MATDPAAARDSTDRLVRLVEDGLPGTSTFGAEGPILVSEPTRNPAAATDAWLTPFEGSGREWHESLPSPYTYQPSDFSELVAAVHEYECEVQLLRESLHRCREDYHAKVLALLAERQPKPKPDGGQIHA